MGEPFCSSGPRSVPAFTKRTGRIIGGIRRGTEMHLRQRISHDVLVAKSKSLMLLLGIILIPLSSLAESLPENAHKNQYGTDWNCDRGFYRSGDQCKAVVIPENGVLNYLGNDWICDSGFKKLGNSCISMRPQEIHKQKELEQALITKIKMSKLRGVNGDHCETEYKTNAEVCVKIESGNLDCHESFLGKYYSDCDVDLRYEVETDYSGGASLDVEVECRVEIEYKGRHTYLTLSDSSSREESHTLYAYDSESESMRFNFSFMSLSEITHVKIRSAKCEIGNIELW